MRHITRYEIINPVTTFFSIANKLTFALVVLKVPQAYGKNRIHHA